MKHNYSTKSHIYLITNLLNGKSYVGQHNGQHKYYFTGGTIVKKAIKKYGRDNFTRVIIEEGNFSTEQLNTLEIFYINKYNTLVPNGYNISIDGTGLYRRGNKAWNSGGGVYTKETLENMSKAKKGKPLNTEHAENVRKSNKKRYENGELSKMWENPRKGAEMHNSRKILEYTIDGNFVREWDCISDAEREYKIIDIGKCLRGVCKTAGNKIFHYFKENYPLKIDVDLEVVTRKVEMLNSQKEVIKEFKNVREASLWIFNNLNTIKHRLNDIKSLNGILRTKLNKELFYRGFYWKWGNHPKKEIFN